jgi:rhodanese-related sulfurtransferase
MGIQLFGADYEYGFNIQNRKDLSPFTYYASRRNVYMLNNRFKIANQINFEEKYGELILYTVIGGPFEDLYVFTEKALYILDYDLRLKNRVNLDSILDTVKLSNNADFEVTKETLFNIHVISHNKNLYAVINRKPASTDDNPLTAKTEGVGILKIILNPENDTDDAALKNAGKNMAVAARVMGKNEFITNFITASSSEENKELIQTKHVIRSIFVHNDILYAVNYNITKLSFDDDTIYGLVLPELSDENGWYYMYNQSINRMLSAKASAKYAEFFSENGITHVANGPNGYFGLVRNINDKNALLTNGSRKILEIYDRSKTKIYNYPLENVTNIISFDYYRYIDEAHEEHDSYVVLAETTGFITAFEYQSDIERMRIHLLDIVEAPLTNFRHIIDSDKFVSKLNENKLYFNLYLDEFKKITHTWNLKEAQEGWYNINVEIDTDKAIFNIKINDNIVGEYNKSTHDFFKAHRHVNNSLFDQTYYFGAVCKKYGATLNEILNNNQIPDPYIVKNTRVENTTLFNKTLEYYEYQAMRLKFEKIGKLILTLPCGVRNGIEEIVRYFKFAKPGSLSNNVKINISGADIITLDSEKNFIKNSIINAAKEHDCLQNINSINFI